MRRLRLAVIGGGHLGRIHTRLLLSHPGIDLVGVVDPSEEARARIAAEFQVRTFADQAEVADHLDGAIVAANTQFHATIARDLLSRGVHLLVEKPLTTSVALADEMIRLAEEHGLVLQVGHVERFSPAWRAARRFLHQPRYIEAARTSGYTFRSTDIGVVHDLMIHDLDLVLSVVASQVAHVEAIGTTLFGPFEDVAQARLRFQNGCIANLTASRVSAQAQRTMQVVTRRGFATIDFSANSVQWIMPDKKILRRQWDVGSMTPDQKDRVKNHLFSDYLVKRELPVVACNAIQDEQREFVECVLHRRTPAVSGRDARECLAVAEQILLRMKQPSSGMVGRSGTPRILTSAQWQQADASPPQRKAS